MLKGCVYSSNVALPPSMATVSHPMFHGQMGFESDGHQKKSFDDDDEHEGKRNNLNLSVKTEQHELNVADVLSEHSIPKLMQMKSFHRPKTYQFTCMV